MRGRQLHVDSVLNGDTANLRRPCSDQSRAPFRPQPIGVYVHLPFCRAKCTYCDFNSVVADTALRRRYLWALRQEIAMVPLSVPVATVYFGGGTPTIYSPQDLASILAVLQDSYTLLPQVEVTCEANPGTVDAPALHALRSAGFNRLSVGVQSLHDDELRLLGRIHTADQARAVLCDARAAGFDNLSVDLIRGLPGQRLKRWQQTLDQVIALQPEHVSVYGLSVEPGTPLAARIRTGSLPAPPSDEQADWIGWTVARLRQAGYVRYEIANFARPGRECRHNLNYWRRGPYLGLGAGAWSFLDGRRRRNVVIPEQYVRAVEAGEELTVDTERLEGRAALGEAIMLGLRTTKGVSRQELRDQFGVDVLDEWPDLIRRLVSAGLMAHDGDRLRLTDAGMLVQNAVAVQFLE